MAKQRGEKEEEMIKIFEGNRRTEPRIDFSCREKICAQMN